MKCPKCGIVSLCGEIGELFLCRKCGYLVDVKNGESRQIHYLRSEVLEVELGFIGWWKDIRYLSEQYINLDDLIYKVKKKKLEEIQQMNSCIESLIQVLEKDINQAADLG